MAKGKLLSKPPSRKVLILLLIAVVGLIAFLIWRTKGKKEHFSCKPGDPKIYEHRRREWNEKKKKWECPDDKNNPWKDTKCDWTQHGTVLGELQCRRMWPGLKHNKDKAYEELKKKTGKRYGCNLGNEYTRVYSDWSNKDKKECPEGYKPTGCDDDGMGTFDKKYCSMSLRKAIQKKYPGVFDFQKKSKCCITIDLDKDKDGFGQKVADAAGGTAPDAGFFFSMANGKKKNGDDWKDNPLWLEFKGK